MTRYLLEEGDRICPACGEQKERLSRHWSFCEFPDVGGDLRELLLGILLGAGSLQGNGENTRHLLVKTTSEGVARWLFGELGWLAHSLRRETFEGEREPLYHVRTHAHTHLRRLRDDWYRDGEKQLQTDTSPTASAARVWWALAGGLEWSGPHDSQVRGTFSAEADERAAAIQTVLSRLSVSSERVGDRVVFYADELREWLGWIGEPVPGVEHKWALSRVEYLAHRELDAGSTAPPVALSKAALQVARERTEQELTPEQFEDVVDEISADDVADALGGGSWRDALSVAGVDRVPKPEPQRNQPLGHSEGKGNEWAESGAVAAMEAAAADLGEPLHQENYREWVRSDQHTGPSVWTIHNRWGWHETAAKAGVEVGTPGNTKDYSDEEMLNCIRRAAAWVGTESNLRGKDYRNWREDESPDAPSYWAIQDRWSWGDACKLAGVAAARDRDTWKASDEDN